MTKLEFSIRLITLISCFGLIIYIISADKPVVIVASLISIIVAALSGDWSRLNGSTTTIINNDEGEQ